MKNKIFTIIISLIFIFEAFSQSNLNNYKYVIVPKKYDFLKEENQFRLNELTKFLFEKHKFSTLMEGENYPDDLLRDRCLALKSDVINDSGLFKTKLKVELKDCNNQVVYSSEFGETREKDFGKAYTEALRNAFISFETVSYKYEPKENKESLQGNEDLTKESLKEESSVVEIPTNETKAIAVPALAVIESTNKPSNEINVSNILYAQATENGFQLVDSSPKVVYKIQKTGLNNVFLVAGKNGVLYEKDGNWILEFYENNNFKQETLNIKF